MTIQEILKKIGLSDEQINTILTEMKTNKIYTSNEENIDIRYGKLKADHEDIVKQYNAAQKLVEELKKAATNNDELQKKISEYDGTITNLKTQITNEKLTSAIKIGLLSEKATDVDYLIYKLKEVGELELDDKDQIKDWSNKINDLKTKYPNHFEKSQTKKVEPNPLKKGNSEIPITKDDIHKMPYFKRAELYQKDPESFNQIINS